MIGTGSLQVSLADVAALARVRRPVVSVWRSRSRSSDLPFPAPVAMERGQERFDLEAVVDWLEATGRGNNADVRGDAAAFALPKGVSPADDEQVFLALTALLCLKAVSGELLADKSAEELGDLADQWDPDDELFLREIETLGDRAPTLASFADELADAAYSPVGAFERLLGQRFRLQLAGHVVAHLDQKAQRLLTSTAAALAREAGVDPGVFVDPTPGGSDLLVALGATAEGETATMVVPDGDDPAARVVRRRLRVHDIGYETLTVDHGAFDVAGPAVLLTAFPAPGKPQVDPEEILTAIDHIQLQMSDRQRAVVCAPARVLTDKLADRRLDQQRDHLLRLGRVRAIVRLGEGLVTARPRQALALWVLGPDHAHVRAEDRWTSVADLGQTTLEPAVVEDVVSDLVAAMGDEYDVRAHAFRFIRLAPTRSLLAGRGPLVPPRAALGRSEPVTAAELGLQVTRTREQLALPLAGDPLAGLDVVPADGDAPGRLPVAELVARGRLQAIPGNRIRPDDVDAGGVPLLGVEELTGSEPVGRRGVDRLLLADRYAAARLTEPGDVVFITSPRPAAVVDRDGGSVVCYPARVLRIVPADDSRGCLLASVAADDINALPAHARSWRSWPLRLVPTDQAPALADALDRLDAAQAAVRSRATALADLRAAITRGITAGALTATTRDSPTSSDHPEPQTTDREDH